MPRVIVTSINGNHTEWMQKAAETEVGRWNPKDIHGQSVPSRGTQEIIYKLSKAESIFDSSLEGVFRTIFVTRPIVASLVRRRWHSSAFAIEQTLRNTLLMTEVGTPAMLADDRNGQLESDPDVQDGLDDQAFSSELPDLPSESLARLLLTLEDLTTDSKWQACEGLIRTFGGGTLNTVLIFTTYKNTADYIGAVAEEIGLPVFVLSGATSLEHREAAVSAARSQPAILILTQIAVFGVDLSFIQHVIHYDLPTDTSQLLQRYGSVERVINQPHATHHYFFIREGSEEVNRIKELLEGVDSLH